MSEVISISVIEEVTSINIIDDVSIEIIDDVLITEDTIKLVVSRELDEAELILDEILGEK